jgi:hypothetical protein
VEFSDAWGESRAAVFLMERSGILGRRGFRIVACDALVSGRGLSRLGRCAEMRRWVRAEPIDVKSLLAGLKMLVGGSNRALMHAFDHAPDYALDHALDHDFVIAVADGNKLKDRPN